MSRSSFTLSASGLWALALAAIALQRAVPVSVSAEPPEVCTLDAVADYVQAAGPPIPASGIPWQSVPKLTRIEAQGELRDVFLYVTAATRTGAGIRFVAADAVTGMVLLDAGQSDANFSPAAVSAAPSVLTDVSGVAYRAYAGDMGGILWRVDLRADVEGARVTAFADFGASGTAAEQIAFPYSPDLFRSFDAAGPYDGVVIVARVGNVPDTRLDLFVLRDSRAAASPSAPIVIADLADPDACEETGEECVTQGSAGWRSRDVSPGSALASAPLVDSGRIFLNTFRPETVACDEGTAERFAVFVSLESGTPLAPGDGVLSLGRGPVGETSLREGRIHMPGLDAAITALGVPGTFLDAAGLRTRFLYRLDLLLDADR